MKVKKVLLNDDDFDDSVEQYGDQVINEEGMMELRSTKQRLQQQAKATKRNFKANAQT